MFSKLEKTKKAENRFFPYQCGNINIWCENEMAYFSTAAPWGA
jgi:hypothetical protein